MRVIQRLSELADHLQARLQLKVCIARHEMVETLPVLAVSEDDRRAGQEFVTVLFRADDPVVRDALQRQVLAMRGALDGLAVVLGCCFLGEVDPDAARIVVGQRRVDGEVVLPGRPGVERLRVQLVRADPADPVQARDADLA